MFVFGMLMLPTLWLPLGLLLILAAWWIYERAPRRAMAGGEDRLYALIGLVAVLGVLIIVAQWAWPHVRTLL